MVLCRWIRTLATCRNASLALLQKLPVTVPDLQGSRIVASISRVMMADGKPDNRQRAAAILERWRVDGLLDQLSEPQSQAPALEPPSKRPRFDGETTNQQVPGAEHLPPDLAGLDPRIAAVLIARPDVHEFLRKHPGIMNACSLNAENIKFITRNLKNARQTSTDDDKHSASTHSTTVTVSNLHPDVREEDVSGIFERLGVPTMDVCLPRESRRQRSCGTAFVILPSREAAREAVRRLQNAQLMGRTLQAESAAGNLNSPVRRPSPGGPANATIDVDALEDPFAAAGVAAEGPNGSGGAAGRVSWQEDAQLWEVVLFDKCDSVSEFGERLAGNAAAPTAAAAPEVTAEVHAKFQAAAKSERAQESQVVREALASQSQ